MEMSSVAFVFAGHATVVMVTMLFWFRFIALAASARRGEVPASVLVPMPLAAMLVSSIFWTEAIYYASARLLIDVGINLWKIHSVVAAMRLCVALSVYAFMPSYFRWLGMGNGAIRKRVAAEITVIIGLWLIMASVLY